MLMSGTHVKDSATHFSCVQQALLQLVICCKDYINVVTPLRIDVYIPLQNSHVSWRLAEM